MIRMRKKKPQNVKKPQVKDVLTEKPRNKDYLKNKF